VGTVGKERAAKIADCHDLSAVLRSVLGMNDCK